MIWNYSIVIFGLMIVIQFEEGINWSIWDVCSIVIVVEVELLTCWDGGQHITFEWFGLQLWT